jgi:hypothetical protein
MVTVWTVLTAIAPVLAPIVSLILIFVGRVIWNQEKRIRSLESSETRHGRTLYGDDDDLRQQGLSSDIRDVIDRLDRLEDKIDELNVHYNRSEDD